MRAGTEWSAVMAVVMTAVGAARAQPMPEPTWPVECSAAATPPRHLYCNRAGNAFDLRALYGPGLNGGPAPTAIRNNPSVPRNTERHDTWKVETGYAYLDGRKRRETDGQVVADRVNIRALSYWMSLRSTRSLLSSPGSVVIMEMVEPAQKSGNQWVRARCYLLDEHDEQVHTALCRRLAALSGEVQETRELAEGDYVEFFSATENGVSWAMGPARKIADLDKDAPARKFLEHAVKNAEDQGLEPPPLPPPR